jgi:hypothetical protein
MSQLPVQLLDLSSLLIIAESHTHSVHACASCSANTMQIAFGFVRETEVDHGFDVGDIQATGNQIGCQQIVNIAFLELFNRVHSLFLGQISVHLSRLQVVDLKQDHHTMALHFLIEEYNHSFLEGLQAHVNQGRLSTHQISIGRDLSYLTSGFLSLLLVGLLFLFSVLAVITAIGVAVRVGARTLATLFIVVVEALMVATLFVDVVLSFLIV